MAEETSMFRGWLICTYGDELSQAGHLARLVAEDPTFPADPTWAQICDWVNAAPDPDGQGAYVLSWFESLRKRYQVWQSFAAR